MEMEFGLYSNMDRGKDRGEVKLELHMSTVEHSCEPSTTVSKIQGME